MIVSSSSLFCAKRDPRCLVERIAKSKSSKVVELRVEWWGQL
jgi:hypothetical protein